MNRLETNEIGWFAVKKGDPDAAFAGAPHTLRRRIVHHRYAAMPMECRAVAAEYDVRTDAYTIWSSTQVAHWVRSEVATTLAVPEGRVRVIAPDVGGGFGVKGHVYPEDVLMPFLARMSGRPVRWVEERREHVLCSCHSRDQRHDAEIAFDGDGRILAVRDRFVVDCGAWNPLGVAVVYNTAAHLPGPYRIPNFSVEARVAATNKAPNAPYRGAGRPEAVQVMERLVDLVATELELDPVEVRRRNMIRADEMPYAQGIPYRDGEPIVYDSGDYPAALDKALEAIGGLSAFRARQREAWKAGRFLGLGIGCYIEGTGVGSFEGATVRIDPSGKIHLFVRRLPAWPGHGDRVRPDRRGRVGRAAGGRASARSATRRRFRWATAPSRAAPRSRSRRRSCWRASRLRDKVLAIAGHRLECAVDRPRAARRRGRRRGRAGCLAHTR